MLYAPRNKNFGWEGCTAAALSSIMFLCLWCKSLSSKLSAYFTINTMTTKARQTLHPVHLHICINEDLQSWLLIQLVLVANVHWFCKYWNTSPGNHWLYHNVRGLPETRNVNNRKYNTLTKLYLRLSLCSKYHNIRGYPLMIVLLHPGGFATFIIEQKT